MQSTLLVRHDGPVLDPAWTVSDVGLEDLAWTQGRSRMRWFCGKLAVAGLATLAVQGLVSLTLTWWWSPVGRANPNRFPPALFGTFGITPLGYAASALALGITAGVVIGRTIHRPRRAAWRTGGPQFLPAPDA